MKTTSHLSSARLYSLIILVAVYVEIDLVRSYSNRVTWLFEARKEFATEYLKQHQDESPPEEDIAGVGHVSAKFFDITGESESRSESVLDFGNAPKRGWSVAVRRSDGRRWQVLIPETDLITREQNGPRKETGSADSTPAEADQNLKAQIRLKAPEEGSVNPGLQRIATEIDLKEPDTEKSNLLLHDIERQLVDKKITIPLIGLEFTPDGVPWIIGLLTIGFLLLIRNQVRQVLVDSELALDEPWIVLDGDRGLEKLLGGGWLLAICISPWAASSCLVAVFSGRIIAEGAATTALTDVAASAAILLLAVLGGWTSLTVTGDLLLLRRLRQERLRELVIASDR